MGTPVLRHAMGGPWATLDSAFFVGFEAKPRKCTGTIFSSCDSPALPPEQQDMSGRRGGEGRVAICVSPRAAEAVAELARGRGSQWSPAGGARLSPGGGQRLPWPFPPAFAQSWGVRPLG